MQLKDFVLVLAIINSATGTTVLPDRLRTSACPGEVIQYSCYESSQTALTTITWGLMVYCSGEQYLTTISVEESDRDEQLHCTSDRGNVIFSITASYESRADGVRSNISVTIPDYLPTGTMSLRIECEDSTDYRYINVTGPPPPPLNFLFRFEASCNRTHIPTIFSWSPPQSQGDIGIEGYGLMFISSPREVLEFHASVNSSTRSVSVPLQYSVTYSVQLYATRCRSLLKSSNASLSILPPLNHIISCSTPSNESFPGLRFINVSACTLYFQCSEGLVPQNETVSKCGWDGSWYPDPAQYMCMQTAGAGSSKDTVITVSVVSVALILSLCLTLSLTAYLLYNCHILATKSYQKDAPSKENSNEDGCTKVEAAMPMSEAGANVELNENIAYAHMPGQEWNKTMASAGLPGSEWSGGVAHDDDMHASEEIENVTYVAIGAVAQQIKSIK